MSALTFLIPLGLLAAAGAIGAFAWAVRSGQLDDLDTPPLRAVFHGDGDQQ